MRKFLLTLLGVLLVGCSSAKEIQRSSSDIGYFVDPVIYRFTSKREVDSLLERAKSDFDSLYYPLRDSVSEVNLYAPGPMFFPRPLGFVNHGEREINYCFSQYGFSGLAHEASHVNEQTVGEEFYNEWNKNIDLSIIADSTGEFDYPMGGFLCKYGAKRCAMSSCDGLVRYHEDIATFVEDINGDFGLLRGGNPKDGRYREKIGLLRKYGFISYGQYRHALWNLGRGFKKNQ